MTAPQDRTAAARKARHLNALRRKAPAMVEALRELGYTVIEPKCGQHYWCDNAQAITVCARPAGHDASHSWLEE